MIHTNSPSVLLIILIIPTVRVLETARSFILILIHGYHHAWVKMAALQGINVIGYGLERLIMDTIIIHFTQLKI